MTKSKSYELKRIAKRGLLAVSMAIGSLSLANVTEQGVAQASGPDMTNLVLQDGSGITSLFEHYQSNSAIASDKFVNNVNHIQVTLASKHGRFVLRETVASSYTVNENTLKQIQVEAFFPTKNPDIKPLMAADYVLDFENGKVTDAYATYINTENTKLINVNYVPTLSKEILGDPTTGKITADEYNLSKPSDMSTPESLKINFDERTSDANFIAITIGNLIIDATAKERVDGKTVEPVLPLAGNIS